MVAIGLRIHFQDSIKDLATALATAELAITKIQDLYCAKLAVLNEDYLLVQSLRRTNLPLHYFP